ncbi:MAG: ATP-binding cassette domain-containing protein [Gammaproteobacteria bacterium]|nr:MAG: ATP-binding cassette domain-containing protein [Gammaproteobacteria bacterium]
MLDIRRLTFAYSSQATPWVFDFKVEPGQCLAIQGPSGSGKSTLMNLIAGFLAPESGDIRFNGQSLLAAAPWDRPVTSVFQDHNLFEHLDVKTNVGLGVHPGMKLSSTQMNSIIDGLQRVGLAGLENRLPSELSGGQRQRVALLRAVMRSQPVLLLDEPLTGLDSATRTQLRDLLLEQKSRGVTMILASHDDEDRHVLADTSWSL